MYLRTCVGCGQTDDHPKHVLVVDGVTHESVAWHMDCHRLSDAGCLPCADQTAGAEDLKGAELREHIVANTPTPEAEEG